MLNLVSNRRITTIANNILIKLGIEDKSIVKTFKLFVSRYSDVIKVLYHYKMLKHDPLYSFHMLESGLKDNPMGEFNGERRNIIERIFKAYEKAKKDQESVVFPYQVHGLWESILKRSFYDFMKAFHNRDYKAADRILSNFFRDKISLGLCDRYENLNLKLHKIDFINVVVAKYRLWEEFKREETNLEPLPPVGNPFGYIIEGKLTNPDALRHIYYADRIEALLDDVKDPIIAEIGGGFGGLAYFISKRGFKYIDFDIPEVCIIASYYLLNALPEKNIKLYEEYDIRNIRNGVDQYDILIMPNFEIQKLPELSVDMFFNSYSFTEMDEWTVCEYYRQIERTCRKYFLHVNNEDDSVFISSEGKEIRYNIKGIELSKEIFKLIYRIPEMLEPFDTRYELIPCVCSKNYEYLYERRSSVREGI
ncbi:MAG: hypothetical protein DRP08_07150 [Candidatus Aenigmatarchaeota archaeon]|nr:MAG: hypothetical protein DRP08_07150 [Candidatus Aenigmarchaeota archaeon]